MVYEEKILTGYDIAPLQAVGWEGKYIFLPYQRICAIEILVTFSRKN